MSQDEIISKVREAVTEDPHQDVIESISLFGSFLHGDNTPDSDVDLLVELRKQIGFFTLMEIQNRIEDKIGKKVELMTKESISRYFRDQVIKEAKKIYQSEPTRR